MHDHCVRCGSPLRASRSQRLGMSVACLATTGRVLASLNASPAQVAKVGVALDLHTYEHVGVDLYRVQSASGTARYLCSTISCQCSASAFATGGIPRCWHVALVRCLEA